MNLPNNADDITEKFPGLTAERKAEILQHLKSTLPDRLPDTVKVLSENGGPEAALVKALFPSIPRSPSDAPMNKRSEPVSTSATGQPRPAAGTGNTVLPSDHQSDGGKYGTK